MSEQSVAGDEPTAPAATGHPLGQPASATAPQTSAKPPTVSIVDTILDLDELMSADVRRAEKTARFATRADLEGDIDELEAELERLVDAQGAPVRTPDAAVSGTTEEGDRVRTAYEVALDLQTKQAEYGASFRSVRMRQVPDEDWLAFEAKWKQAIDAGPSYPVEFWNELIAMSAHTPKIPLEKIPGMRKKLGHPPMDVLGKVAWDVNANAGVSIPKSRLSSAVLRRGAQTQS
jgi:hypothetical protein